MAIKRFRCAFVRFREEWGIRNLFSIVLRFVVMSSPPPVADDVTVECSFEAGEEVSYEMAKSKREVGLQSHQA